MNCNDVEKQYHDEEGNESLDRKAMIEVAHEINRQALVKHLLLQEPVEALKLHLQALDLEIEYSKFLVREQEIEDANRINLEERQKHLALDLVVTLIDIGNCFWSSQRSKVAYYSALTIYRLMDIDKPILTTSIFNRLCKLECWNYRVPYDIVNVTATMNDTIPVLDDEQHHAHQRSFNKSIEVTKIAVARLQAKFSEQH